MLLKVYRGRSYHLYVYRDDSLILKSERFLKGHTRLLYSRGGLSRGLKCGYKGSVEWPVRRPCGIAIHI